MGENRDSLPLTCVSTHFLFLPTTPLPRLYSPENARRGPMILETQHSPAHSMEPFLPQPSASLLPFYHQLLP